MSYEALFEIKLDVELIKRNITDKPLSVCIKENSINIKQAKEIVKVIDEIESLVIESVIRSVLKEEGISAKEKTIDYIKNKLKDNELLNGIYKKAKNNKKAVIGAAAASAAGAAGLYALAKYRKRKLAKKELDKSKGAR